MAQSSDANDTSKWQSLSPHSPVADLDVLQTENDITFL